MSAPGADGRELADLLQRVTALPPGEQLLLAESILGGLRRTHFHDDEVLRQDLAALVAHERVALATAGRGTVRDAG
jgi:hypothetical protein